MNAHVDVLPLWTYLLLAVLLLCQGTWLFLDGRGRSRHPWFWGLWGMMSCPLPLIVYLFVVRKAGRKRFTTRRGRHHE